MNDPTPDSRTYWKRRARFTQLLLDKARHRLNKTRVNLTQALEDHDNLEAELRALLTPASSEAAHEILLSLTHHDLALLADEYRAKYLTLQKGATPCH